MRNLMKMERYQLLRNPVYWLCLAAVFLSGFLTADTYLPEVLGPGGGAATCLADIFNGMVYDSTFLLILVSCVLALLLGQDFSHRTIDHQISAGHSRLGVMLAKSITYLMAFHLVLLSYPLAGCLREFPRFGLGAGGTLLWQALRGVGYSLLLNSGMLLVAVALCCYLKSAAKSVAATAVASFAISLYFAYGTQLELPVAFLPIYQIRQAVTSSRYLLPGALAVGCAWTAGLLLICWASLRRCDLK